MVCILHTTECCTVTVYNTVHTLLSQRTKWISKQIATIFADAAHRSVYYVQMSRFNACVSMAFLSIFRFVSVVLLILFFVMAIIQTANGNQMNWCLCCVCVCDTQLATLQVINVIHKLTKNTFINKNATIAAHSQIHEKRAMHGRLLVDRNRICMFS